MPLSWLSLVPTCIVILTACITHNVNGALIGGIITAGFIAAQYSVTNAFLLIFQHVYHQITDIDNLMLYLFLISIANLAILLTQTGSGIAFTHALRKRIHTKRGAETTSVFFSFLMSVDDYLSILSVGHIVRMLTDKFGITRLRLAYLIHSLAGPLVILMPISSWVATITGQLHASGIDTPTTTTPNPLIAADPFTVYLATMPFIFYALIIIMSVMLVVITQRYMGPMTTEHSPQQLSTHSTTKEKSTSLAGLLLPLAALLCTFISGSLLIDNQPFLVMCIAGMTSFAVALAYALYEKTISLSDIPLISTAGLSLMRNAILMIFLASILAVLLKENLKTGLFLAQLVHTTATLHLLPLIFFVLSLISAIATGSAWGTFALMISIAIPMIASLVNGVTLIPSDIPLLYPILGAILSGSVCGDHISPFSETTVMTATSTATHPFTHAYTQFFYALPALIGTAVSFLCVGYLTHMNYWSQIAISLFVGMSICVILLYVFSTSKK